MACLEFDSAVAWLAKGQQSGGKTQFPVTMFLTKHTGFVTDPAGSGSQSLDKDFCWYARGGVGLNAAGHLFGDLRLSLNNGAGEDMAPSLKSTVGVEVFPDGHVTYQQKINGKPVGGMPPVAVTGMTCIGGALLSGVHQNDVVVVGVRRDPSVSVPS